MVIMIMLVMVMVMRWLRAAAALAVTACSGGLFIPRRFTHPLILMIMGGLAGTAADRRGTVTAVAVVLMLVLAGGRLADGLDGGGGSLMAAAGFAHDESLLDGSRRCEIFDD
jgi:hypothetical protein